MKYWKRIFFTALCLFLVTPSAWATGQGNFSFKLFYWLPELEGTIQNTQSSFGEVDINVQRDLGLGQPGDLKTAEDIIERALGFEAGMNAGFFGLNLRGFRTRWRGESTLTREINFAGQTFNVSTDTESRVELEMLDLDIKLNLLNKSPLYLSGIIGTKYFNFYGRIEEKGTGQTEEETQEGIFPYVGVQAMVDIAKVVSVYGRLVGMGGSIDEEEFTIEEFSYLEGSIGVQVNIGEFLSFGIEYRALQIKFEGTVEGEKIDFELKLGGMTEEVDHGLSYFVILKF